ncbi:SGNH/GDSL hydrolase family protein [Actinokineospora sp. NBRC 105648]|uniref:SGNH/GDSL hydrolase family protein n=1 Tax=Actinokineospora sp. NBRC 105648 TaxID=3032206 RepID=UPI00249FF248|nr:SGNH/GDSL hydrolase family protein [Actinokineospora sp. NBRC 105648]GLZ42396.1 lipase [Actinokineospora sp. NBRC 105648]
MRGSALALTMLFVLASAAPATAAEAPAARYEHVAYQHYVALGDSYASGPGIPEQNGTPLGCGRSDHNYPGRLARWLRVVKFTDVSCAGATTANMAGPQVVQDGANPPQLEALRPETDLVTLTIGGNDIGFGEILGTCGQTGSTDPTGAPCREHYTSGGTDVLANRVAVAGKRVATVLAEIRTRSPRARVLVVGYLRILPTGAGCWPQVPFAAGDTEYFDRTERSLNEALAAVTRTAGARFVNPYLYSTTHDACQPDDRRWVEPLRPASPAAPIHPNEQGMTVVAGLTWLATLSPR